MDISGLNDWLSERSLQGYWTLDRGSHGSGPQAGFRPFLWKWGDMATALEHAGDLIPPEESFRRFIGYVHPETKTGASHTVLLGAQLVLREEPAVRRRSKALPDRLGDLAAVDGMVEGSADGDVAQSVEWASQLEPVLRLDRIEPP